MTTLAVAQSDGQMHGGKSGAANAGHGNLGQGITNPHKGDNNMVGGWNGTTNGYYSGTGERSEQGLEAVEGAWGKAVDRAFDKGWGE